MSGNSNNVTFRGRAGLLVLRMLARAQAAIGHAARQLSAMPRTRVELGAQLQSTRRYWRVRASVQRLLFGLRRRGLRAQRSLRSSRGEDRSLLKALGRLLMGAGLVALTLGTAMALDSLLAPGVARFAPRLFRVIVNSGDDFASTALVTLQLGAIVLGLYLAALSVIVSTVYRQSISSVRRAAEDEVLGNVGVRSTGFLSLLSLGCLVVVTFLGHEPGVTLWLLLIGTTAFAVVSLVPATRSAFDLFSSTSLLRRMLRGVIDAIETALHEDGFTRSSQAIQRSCRFEVRQGLRNIRALMEIAETSPFHSRSTSWSTFGGYLSSTLAIYWSKKGGFSPESLWFDRTPVHESWFTASHYEASVALHVGHFLTPIEIPDHLWLEREIGTQLMSLIDDAASVGAWPEVASLVSLQSSLTKDAASRGAVDAALLFADFASASTKTVEASLTCSPAEALDTKNKELLAAYSQAVDWPIALSVGFVQWAQGFSTSFIDHAADELLALKPPAGWPDMEAAAHVWNLRVKLATERRIEGRVLTARWYAVEMCAYATARLAIRAAEGLVVVAERALADVTTRMEQQDLAFLAATESLGRMGIRLTSSFEGLVSVTETLEVFQVTFDSWPELDTETLRARLHAVRDGFVEAAPAYGAAADSVPSSTQLPDYLGFGQTLLCEACFDALMKRDAAAFRTAFRALLNLTVRAEGRLRTARLEYQGGVPVLIEPILDLMTVSGAAYLVDHSMDVDVWQPVLEGWEALGTAMGGVEELHRYLSVVGSSMTLGLGFTQRSLQRKAWEQQFTTWMSRERLISMDDEHDAFLNTETRRVSTDQLTNHVLSQGTYGLDLVATLLVALVLNVEGMTRDDLPRRATSLLDWVDRHEEAGSDEAQ